MKEAISGDRVANVAIAVLALCAVVLTASVLSRNRRGTPDPGASLVGDWQRYAVGGHRLGPEKASVTIVEFSDFQCPFCAEIAGTLRSLRSRYPADLKVIYHHFPLTIVHRRAEEAALASECAAEQSQFEAFHDLLFAKQAFLDTMSLTAAAGAVGIANRQAFEECLRSKRYAGRLEQDKEMGKRLRIRGTPTMLVNGRRFDGALPSETLDSVVNAAMRGR